MSAEQMTFHNIVDKELSEYMVRLDQKLKGLLAEIEAKMQSLTTDDLSKQELYILTDEVKKAIANIQALAMMRLDENLTAQEFLEMNREGLEELVALFKDNVAKISHLKEKL